MPTLYFTLDHPTTNYGAHRGKCIMCARVSAITARLRVNGIAGILYTLVLTILASIYSQSADNPSSLSCCMHSHGLATFVTHTDIRAPVNG